MSRRRRRAALWAGALLALAGCAAAPERGPGAPPLDDLPHAHYRALAARGERVYVVDPAASELRIFAYRGGRLARLGHDHVLASRELRGYVHLAERPGDSRADLALPLATLILDDPQHRAAAGLATVPSAADIEATRRNLLGEQVLDAARHPFLRLRAAVAGGRPPQLRLAADVSLRGATRRLEVAARIEPAGDGLRISGELSVLQSDFGITPFSVLMGALRVEDRVQVTYRLAATPLSP